MSKRGDNDGDAQSVVRIFDGSGAQLSASTVFTGFAGGVEVGGLVPTPLPPPR